MAVSLNPKDAVEGGLLSDIDATLVSLRFGNYIYDFAKGNDDGDPNGTESVGLIAKLKTPGGDEFRSIASLGNANEWVIQDKDGNPCQPDAHGYIRDGVKADSVKGDKTGLSKSSNAYTFFVEMQAAGFPENKFSDLCSVFDGTFAHWVQKAQKKREGLAQQSEREKTVLVAQKILTHGLPWEASKRKPGAGTSTNANTGNAAVPSSTQAAAVPAASGGDDDLENTTALQIAIDSVKLLRKPVPEGKGGTTVKKSLWGTAKLGAISKVDAFKALGPNDPNRAAVGRILGHAEWMEGQGITLTSAGEAVVKKEGE